MLPVIGISYAWVCTLIYEDHCFECMWEFVYELPEIPVSCIYLEILLVICEMIDPLQGAPS